MPSHQFHKNPIFTTFESDLTLHYRSYTPFMLCYRFLSLCPGPTLHDQNDNVYYDPEITLPTVRYEWLCELGELIHAHWTLNQGAKLLAI